VTSYGVLVTHSPWWRDAVIYQIYPRSWADSDGDGIGDLPGITSRLSHLADLGIDAVWLSPFYPSPQLDAGYDVADYRDVDPLFGTLDDFDRLVERAHALGLRVIVDVVPNHTSAEHPWFQDALAAAPGSPERARYLFRDGRDGGETPPNNWPSRFGGSAWTRVTDGQWYLHLFDVSQPDLDWTNPEVHAEFESILRFWLDRGVDGFRVDVAHGLIKAPGLPDATSDRLPMWDQPGVHDVYRNWRRLVDSYDGERILCAEAWVGSGEALARYVRPDEMHQSFNFNFLTTSWRADLLRATIDDSLHHAATVGAPQTWVLSNHDVVRHATRLGRADATEIVDTSGIGPDDPQPDPVLGLRRARAATTLMLALPGSAYLYQGEELGLPDATTLPDDVRQDPTWERSGHSDRGRDGCRVPVPWSPEGPSLGFGPGASWLPQPAAYADLAPVRQRGVPGSTLELYRRLLAVRRDRRLGTASLTWLEPAALGWGDDVIAFDLVDRGLRVVANLGPEPIGLPAGCDVVLASGEVRDGRLRTDMTAWLHVDDDTTVAPS